MTALELQFAADHPAGPGHFPGNPIIPGACLLDETLRAIGAALGRSLAPCRISAVKFFHPVRPGDRVAVEFDHAGEDGVTFICTVGGTKVMAGQVSW